MDFVNEYPTCFIDAGTLLIALKDYSNPRDAIARLVKSGELIRVKNGLFLIRSKLREGVPLEQLANMIYSPSYVTLEWALSYYGLIPERVSSITSVTLGKKKEYKTTVGHFVYYPLSLPRYAIGRDSFASKNSPGRFLIATKEKALLDYVFIRKKKFETKEEFMSSTRIEEEDLSEFNFEALKAMSVYYDHPLISQFVRLLCN